MTSTQEFNCVFCKEIFNTKEELQIHFRKHGDPKFNQSLKNKNRFQNEAQLPGEKTSDSNEMVSCDVCSEMFPTISKAITHKHRVHPDHDAKYFCPWCGKVFTMKHLYNKHLQTSHESTEKKGDSNFHCDCCDVNFFLPSAMLYHNKFFHRQDSELPAIGQSKKQKLFNQELIQIYYCAFCGEEYNNKVNLHKHMGDDHTDENQSPDDVLRCPLCEAIFFHLDAYELHLTFHSSEDVYSETNEMNATEISEYSLETVPPIMEKVENYEPQADAEKALNAMGIENFLQIAMDEQIDNQNVEIASEKTKSKKHKKHKKSKKSAITLDEFLNMNKDVFGEGLDVQGIEEVPTRIVKKQLKNKKQLRIQDSGVNLMSSSDLEKLKQQGIVVKVKSAKTPILHGIKIGSKIPAGKPIKIANSSIPTKKINETKSNTITTSDDVLSKLINQSNNQIKIIKKPLNENTDVKQNIGQLTMESSDAINETNDQDFEAIENTTTKTDLITSDEMEINDRNEKLNKNEQKKENSNNVNKESINNKMELKSDEISVGENFQEFSAKPRSSCLIEHNEENEKLKDDKANVDNDNNYKTLEKASQNRKDIDVEISNSSVITNNVSESFNALRNISQHVTIKSLNSNDLNKQKPEQSCEKDELIAQSSESQEKIHNDVNHGKDIQKNNTLIEENETNPTKKSLTVLKRLGHHLTVKPMNQMKNNIPEDEDKSKIDFQQEPDNNSDSEKEFLEQSNSKLSHKLTTLTQQNIQNKSETSVIPLYTLKKLSKHITIKSLSQTTPFTKNDSDNYSSDEIDEDTRKHSFNEEDANKPVTKGSKNYSGLKIQIPEHSLSVKTKNPLKNISTDVIVQPGYHSPKMTMKPVLENQYDNISSPNIKDIKKQSNTNLFKHRKNVNAKPATVVKNMNQQVTVKSSTQSMNMMKRNITQKYVKQKEMREDIEIFSVDDSDSDEIENQDSKIYPSVCTVKNLAPTKTPIKTMNVLKNIGKHVTIKATNPINPNASNGGEALCDEINENSMDSDDFVESNYTSNTENIKRNYKPSEEKDLNLKLKLKNLSKHITVTSRNTSPSLSVTSQEQNTQDSNITTQINDPDSDSDSCSSKVKITEINDDDNDNDDDISLKNASVPDNSHIISKSDIQSGNESYSDNNDYKDEELSDVESQIKVNTLKKPICTLNPDKQPLKLKMKCINEKKNDNEEEFKMDNVSQKEVSEIPNKLSNELSIKPYTKMKIIHQDDNDVPNSKTTRQAIARSNQSKTDHNVSTSSNQINTVNKEVTVKTFQTKTVIEEITTTVTKTIRTVNQTVQKEVRNNIQSLSTITPQKVIGMKSPSQPIKNYQGITVRHLSPIIRPKTGTPIRPVVGTAVRPSNQLTPTRPRLNVVRTSAPRMPTIKKVTPTSIQQKTVIGKPLKISPNVITSSKKRAASLEGGHFSCFKKPKESLIPVSDVPAFSNDQESESSVNFASTSHMSQSNYSSSTKIIKGNTVLTSNQVKSETCASSQQLSRLNNVSGLKIVKTSQAKRVEETSEFIVPKRTTLEAIEKLQKQGLLVKKPRLNIDTDSDHSKSEDENDDHHEAIIEESDE